MAHVEVPELSERASYVSIFGRPVHRAWIMLLGCGFFSMATVAVVFSPIGLFYVAVCDEMGFARSDISLWQQVHFLTAIPSMPLAAKALERFGARPCMSVTVIGCAAAALLMGTYTEAWQWSISGFLYGSLGVLGTMQLAGPIVVGNWFGRRAGMAMGIYGIIGAVAAVIVPPVFSVIIEGVGWRAAYMVQGLLILALGLWFTLFVARLRPADAGAIPYGVTLAEARERAVEVIEAGGKAAQEKVPWRSIVSVPFFMLFLFAGISSLIGSGFDAHLAGHGVAKGFDMAFGSLMTSALFLGSGVDKLVMGWLNDKIGVNRTVFLEYAVVIAGMLGLVVFTQPGLVLGASFLFGVQDSFISVSLPLLVRKFFGVEKVAQVLAWASIGSGIFGSFGSRLVGYSYDATGSFDPAFLVGVGLCFVGMACIGVANVSKARSQRRARAAGEAGE
ncbi:MAG: MFS transporter [Eggerthellaceae bacterium]|nr:MFS transporter [Eggerthellaceae bacterium]